jgi:radical SAM superfamily enzyme YgiQ (UPF0313 family)
MGGAFSPKSRYPMADVFLIKLEPDYESYSMAPPFGILYLASSLEGEGFHVKLFHERGTSENIQAIVDRVRMNPPLFVGVSTFTGPSLLPSLIVSSKIKKEVGVPVIWGGIHPTMLPEQTLREDCLDMVVLGEGEKTIIDLANTLADKGPHPANLESIQGIGYKENGVIRVTSSRPFIAHLDHYSPAWHLLDMNRYLRQGDYFYSSIGSQMATYKVAGMITSRGCPWRCGYCYNQSVNKRHFRAQSAEKVVKEIEFLKINYGVTAIAFEDDGFFTNRDRALSIIRKIDLPWSSSIRANDLARWGEKFIGELKACNCFELRIGAESGSQRVLDLMEKDISLGDIYQSAELCLKSKINLLMGFMYGVPGETWSDMLKTFQLIDELDNMGVTIASGPALFFPYPGTPLYDRAIEKGFHPPQRIKDWSVQWGPKQPLLPFVDRRARFVGYYRTIAFRKEIRSFRFPFLVRILKSFARIRWKTRFFSFPLDYYIPHFVLKLVRALKIGRLTDNQ